MPEPGAGCRAGRGLRARIRGRGSRRPRTRRDRLDPSTEMLRIARAPTPPCDSCGTTRDSGPMSSATWFRARSSRGSASSTFRRPRSPGSSTAGRSGFRPAAWCSSRGRPPTRRVRWSSSITRWRRRGGAPGSSRRGVVRRRIRRGVADGRPPRRRPSLPRRPPGGAPTLTGQGVNCIDSSTRPSRMVGRSRR